MEEEEDEFDDRCCTLVLTKPCVVGRTVLIYSELTKEYTECHDYLQGTQKISDVYHAMGLTNKIEMQIKHVYCPIIVSTKPTIGIDVTLAANMMNTCDKTTRPCIPIYLDEETLWDGSVTIPYQLGKSLFHDQQGLEQVLVSQILQ